MSWQIRRSYVEEAEKLKVKSQNQSVFVRWTTPRRYANVKFKTNRFGDTGTINGIHSRNNIRNGVGRRGCSSRGRLWGNKGKREGDEQVAGEGWPRPLLLVPCLPAGMCPWKSCRFKNPSRRATRRATHLAQQVNKKLHSFFPAGLRGTCLVFFFYIVINL